MSDEEDQIKKEIREERESGLERLVMLSDGVFAIAMTLLVLDIKIPADIADFNAGLQELGMKTVYYFLTFLVIGSYWRFHFVLMRNIKSIDRIFAQISLIYLAVVAFFPAVMNLVAEHGEHPQAIIIYVAVLVVCGLLGQVLRFYAYYHPGMVSVTPDPRAFRYSSLFSSIFPLCILLTLLLLFLPSFQENPSSIFWFWFLIPLITLALHLLTRQRRQDLIRDDHVALP